MEYGIKFGREVAYESARRHSAGILSEKPHAHLLQQVNETYRPIIITQNGTVRAVLQDPESYESMKNAFLVLTLMAQGEADIRAERHSDQNEVLERIRARIESRRTQAT